MGDTLSIRLPTALRRQLDRLARKEKRPASDLAREALRRYLIVEELRRLREIARPLAEAQGIFTDEDMFKALE